MSILLFLDTYRLPLMILCSIPIIYSDLRWYIVSPSIALAGSAVFTLVNLALVPQTSHITFALLAFSIVSIYLLRILTRYGMGVGDIYVSALMMSYLNSLRLWYWSLFIAALGGLIVCVVFKRRKIPFAPFMLVAAIVFGEIYRNT